MRILFSVFLMFGVLANAWAQQSNISSTGVVSGSTPTPAAPVQAPAPSPAAPSPAKTPALTEKEKSVTFKSLAQMNELIELGVPALALSLLDEEQKKRPAFSADWYAFEYKRILLLSALERWQLLIERTQWLFDTAKKNRHITKKIRLWFETQQVIARLQLKQSEQALNQLQHLRTDLSRRRFQLLLALQQTAEAGHAGLQPIYLSLVVLSNAPKITQDTEYKH